MKDVAICTEGTCSHTVTILEIDDWMEWAAHYCWLC